MQNFMFYGERGIVNGLVLDIYDNLDRLKKILRAISWCGEQSSDWISDIQNVFYLIEPGFGQFGQPDLIIICQLCNGTHRFVIIETKTTLYHDSAKQNDKGMDVKGYNSSINGQLSLDYRLTLALQDYDDNRKAVEEPSPIFEWYKKRLKETRDKPRKVRKRQLIDEIVIPYLKGLKLQNTFFVAMTTDKDTNPLKLVDDNTKPVVLDENGKDVWARWSAHWGFLSLQTLEADVLNFDGLFRRGYHTFIRPQTKQMGINNFDGQRFPLANWQKFFPKEWGEKVDELAKQISDKISDGIKCKKFNGSYSFIVNSKTLGKLAPRRPENPELMVGFSPVVSSAEDFAKCLGKPERYRLMQEPFWMVSADPEINAEKVVETMVCFLKEAFE